MSKKSEQAFSARIAKRFLILFAAFIAIFYVLWKFLISTSKVAENILNMYAFLAAKVISLFGTDISTDGHIMQSDSFSMNVATGCDGIEPMGYFLCAVLAFPVAFKYKWRGIALGIGILFLLNLIRVISLYYVGIHWESVFEFFHIGVWQILMIAAGGIIWLYWILSTLKKMEVVRHEAS